MLFVSTAYCFGISDILKPIEPLQVYEFGKEGLGYKDVTIVDYGESKIGGETHNVNLVIENTKNDSHHLHIVRQADNDINGAYALTFLVKPEGRNNLTVGAAYSPKKRGPGNISRGSVNLFLDTGVAELNHGNGELEGILEPLNDGWYRAYYSFTSAATRHDNYKPVFWITFKSDDMKKKYPGDGGSGIYIANIEIYDADMY